MSKKTYSVEELLTFAYKHNTIPAVLFAKDRDCRYIYTSEVEDAIDGGAENSILGKTDMDIQFDPELGKLYYEQDKEIMRTGKSVHCYSEFCINGKKSVREISKNPVYSNGEIIGVCGVVSDVTELMGLKEKYERLSILDQKTGSYNRHYFNQRHFDKEECLPCAYFMCDCNDLKKLNDHYGHEMGEQYIQVVSDVLRFVSFEKGACIRWGGDEFLLIVPNCDDEASAALMEQIEQVRKQKTELFPELDIAVGCCIRTSLEQAEEGIIQAADQAMYMDKMRRKNG